jgi:hypothetical protein
MELFGQKDVRRDEHVWIDFTGMDDLVGESAVPVDRCANAFGRDGIDPEPVNDRGAPGKVGGPSHTLRICNVTDSVNNETHKTDSTIGAPLDVNVATPGHGSAGEDVDKARCTGVGNDMAAVPGSGLSTLPGLPILPAF